MNIQAHELEKFLRQFAPLANVEVKYDSELAPTLATICGVVTIYGEPQFYECPVDLADFKSGDDLIQLVTSLMTAFDKAHGELDTH